MEKDVVKDLCMKYNKKEDFIKLLIKICKDNNVLDIRETIIKEYFDK